MTDRWMGGFSISPVRAFGVAGDKKYLQCKIRIMIKGYTDYKLLYSNIGSSVLYLYLIIHTTDRSTQSKLT